MDHLKSGWPYVLAMFIGAAVFANLYPFAFLFGQSDFFQRGDSSQAVAGWWMYAKDGWHFPVFRSEHLMWPTGESIVFTDSIPIMALLFKPFAGLLPEDFHYFGIWHLIVYLSQACAAVFLVRSLGAPRWMTPFAAFFAVTFPALPWRTGHNSLMLHSLVMMSLGVYFAAVRQCMSLKRAHLLFYALQALALLVHAYFFPMVYVLWVAMMLDQREAHGGLRGILKRLGLQLVVLVVFFFLFGFLRGKTESEGFGIYSMNLWAPFTGGKYTPDFVDATGGQKEGFNYLGAGALLLIAGAAIAHGRELLPSLRRHRWFVLMLVGLAIYAVSSRIYIGRVHVGDWPVWLNIKKITDTFRASGRFFWPMGYLLVMGALAVAAVRSRIRVVLPLFAIAAFIQWDDLALLRSSVRTRLAKPPVEESDLLRRAVASASVMGCSPSVIGATADGNDFVLSMHWLAGRRGLKLAGGYVSHGSQTLPEAGDNADVYILSRRLVETHHPEISDYARGLVLQNRFRSLGEYLIYRNDWTDVDWSNRLPDAVPYDWLAHWRPVPLGTPVSHNSPLLEFTSGWSQVEPTHLWSLGTRATLTFKWDALPASRKMTLRFRVLGDQRVTLRLNNREIFAGKSVPEQDGSPSVLKISLSPDMLSSGLNRLEFELPDARTPGTGDSRVLALAFRDMTIE